MSGIDENIFSDDESEDDSDEEEEEEEKEFMDATSELPGKPEEEFKTPRVGIQQIK